MWFVYFAPQLKDVPFINQKESCLMNLIVLTHTHGLLHSYIAYCCVVMLRVKQFHSKQHRFSTVFGSCVLPVIVMQQGARLSGAPSFLWHNALLTQPRLGDVVTVNGHRVLPGGGRFVIPRDGWRKLVYGSVHHSSERLHRHVYQCGRCCSTSRVRRVRMSLCAVWHYVLLTGCNTIIIQSQLRYWLLL